jgi:hypothetical protein
VKEDYFPVAVEFYHNHKNILNFFKPETVTVIETMYPVARIIVDSESVRKSFSILSLIKNVAMEAAQMVVDKFTRAHLNVEMTVAEAIDAIEKCDMNKMVGM